MITAQFRQSESSGEVAARAYWVQYVSLILIVLTFIIGVFASSSLERTSGASGPDVSAGIDVTPAEPEKPKKVMGSMKLVDLFEVSSATVRSEKADALREFLANHDVTAHFEVGSGDLEVDSEDFGLAVARTISLARHFESADVAFENFHIVAVPEVYGYQGNLVFLEAPR